MLVRNGVVAAFALDPDEDAHEVATAEFLVHACQALAPAPTTRPAVDAS
jgi:hypothetical protein